MKKSTEYESRTKTVGQYGLVFGRYENNVDHIRREADTVLYCGLLEHVPNQVWEEIAPIHENFASYNEMAMAALYKGKGKLSSGTESAKAAVLSVLSPLEDEYLENSYEYVVIWKITGNGHYLERENLQVLLRGLALGHNKIRRSEVGKFVSIESPAKWIAELEEKEGTTYRTLPIKEALMEALYGSKYDMSREDTKDWENVVSKAFTNRHE
jgi:hypothetical protein